MTVNVTRIYDRAEAFMQCPKLAAECPDLQRLLLLRFHIYDETSLKVMRDAIQSLQRSYGKHPELLPGLVPSYLDEEEVIRMQCVHRDPTTQKYLRAVLLVCRNDGGKVDRLVAAVGWSRYVDAYLQMDGTPLWSEIVDLEDDESMPASITSDEVD